MGSEDGEVFIKNIAQFVRTHEKSLANALELQRQKSKPGLVTKARKHGESTATTAAASQSHSVSSALVAALSIGTLGLTSPTIKPAKLTLTPHHLFYLLSRFEELDIDVGPMNVRSENIHSDISPTNYVSFLSQSGKHRGPSDRDSIHSVSSVRSAMSNISNFWSAISLSGEARNEKGMTQLEIDLKYLYSAFTKIPCLRLSPDRRARLIHGYEEFPFDTAVPLVAFKNISTLEITDLDFRSFFGWDRMADQLRSLSIRRGEVDDPLDIIVNVVLDDMEKRRRRSSKQQGPPTPMWPPPSPSPRHPELARIHTANEVPIDESRFASSPRRNPSVKHENEITAARTPRHQRNKSSSPSRVLNGSARSGPSYRQSRGSVVGAGGDRMKRSSSGSSNSSSHSLQALSSPRSRSYSNVFSATLPTTKWRFLRHLSLADNALTMISAAGLAPLVDTLHYLDLSSNLFTEIPDCLSTLTALRSLNLSNCMINSLHSLSRNPLPAVSSLNLRGNRLASLAGIERLLSLERLDLRENFLRDPTELARLTGIPEMREIWVAFNPFVRTHGAHRMTIFNLFRGNPGYSEDVILDGSGPGYSERRHLRERAKYLPSVPVVKQMPPAAAAERVVAPVASKKATVVISQVHPQQPNQLQFPPPALAQAIDQNTVPKRQSSLTKTRTEDEIERTSSSGKRKGPRRRIVDLSQDEGHSPNAFQPSSPPPPGLDLIASAAKLNHAVPTPPSSKDGKDSKPVKKPTIVPVPLDDPFVEPPPRHSSAPAEPAKLPKPPPPAPLSSQPPPPPQVVPALKTGASSPAERRAAPPPPALDLVEHISRGNEAYRQKIQALQDEFGSNWLRVFSEGANAAAAAGQLSPPLSPPAPPGLPVGAGMVAAGRSLG